MMFMKKYARWVAKKTSEMISSVVIVNDHAFVAGGASEVAIREAELLAKNGIFVYFFSCTGPASPRLSRCNIKVCLTNQEELKDKKGIRGYLDGIWNTKAASDIGKLLGNLNPAKTIIHVHSYSKALTASIFPKIARMGFRWVFTAHDYFSECPNGAYYDFKLQKHCSLRGLSFKCLVHNCDKRKYWHKIYRFIKGGVARSWGNMPKGANGVIILSNWSDSLLKIEDGNKYFLTNPVEPYYGRLVTPSKHDTYLYVGQLSPEKGSILFAKAAFNTKVKATFVGDGQLRNEILKTNENAILKGWLPKSEIPAYYTNSRALVFPSLWHEVEPLVPAEAMSCGLPVICATTNAAAEYIIHGLNGLLFDPYKPGDLENVIIACKNDEYVDALGRNAAKWMHENWKTEDIHTRELLRIYETIMRGKEYSSAV